jgi:hypothetical protein
VSVVPKTTSLSRLWMQFTDRIGDCPSPKGWGGHSVWVISMTEQQKRDRAQRAVSGENVIVLDQKTGVLAP